MLQHLFFRAASARTIHVPHHPLTHTAAALPRRCAGVWGASSEASSRFLLAVHVAEVAVGVDDISDAAFELLDFYAAGLARCPRPLRPLYPAHFLALLAIESRNPLVPPRVARGTKGPEAGHLLAGRRRTREAAFGFSVP